MNRDISTPDLLKTSSDLLSWYDRHHRDLPWRVPPAKLAIGVRPDPYKVWLSEIMLQQTTVAAVRGYYQTFLKAWPSVHALAAAPIEDVLAAWAGLGYYARARNLHKCAGVVSQELDGAFPETEEGLKALPGIGPYTAAAIAAIAFDRPATVVDGNVERVVARFFSITEPLPGCKPLLRERAAQLTPSHRSGDFAQAMMDLGATICTPRAPACGRCPLSSYCAAYKTGNAGQLPRKAPKVAKPVRRGVVYVAVTPFGEVLVERRPPKGLLGGMIALPTSGWSNAAPREEPPPFRADWISIGEVRHTFTHFHLILDVQMTDRANISGLTLPLDEFEASTATVFAKACRLARAHLGLSTKK